MKNCKCGKQPHLISIDINHTERHTLYHYACMCGQSAPAGMMHANGETIVLGFSSISGAETAWNEHMERLGK